MRRLVVAVVRASAWLPRAAAAEILRDDGVAGGLLEKHRTRAILNTKT